MLRYARGSFSAVRRVLLASKFFAFGPNTSKISIVVFCEELPSPGSQKGVLGWE
jgi:hypothetical protein